MTEKPIAAARRELDAVQKAQEIVRGALLALEAATGKSIESVRVDVRNFANLDTEIWLTEEQRR